MTQSLTSGNYKIKLIVFALPILLSNILQQLYNVADTAIAGSILGADALAAIGSTSAISTLIIGFCQGIGTGFSIPVAQQFGAKNKAELKKYVGASLWVFTFVSVFVTTISVIFCRQIIEIMKTPSNIIEQTYSYLIIILGGIPVVFGYNSLVGILRAIGDNKTPIILMLLSSILHIALEYLMISWLGLGVAGAGYATLISQAAALLGVLAVVLKKSDILNITLSDCKFSIEHIKTLIVFGMPMGFMVTITGIGSILIQTAVNTLGSSAVAAVTIATKATGFLELFCTALGQSCAIFCGQNYGAGNYSRITKGMRFSVLVSIALYVIEFVLIFTFGKTIALLFVTSDEAEILDMAYQYMLITGAFLWAENLIFILRFSLQGLGYSKVILMLGILEMVGRGGIALKFVPQYGFMAACLASPAAWVLSDLLLVSFSIYIMKKFKHMPDKLSID